MFSSQTEPILLVGLTMRMLAEIAVRAHYPVLAIDYFGDADLQALCPSRSLARDYDLAYSPAALVKAAADLAVPAVVYGASLENHPQEVARLARGRQLLGNTPEALKQVRNPNRLAAALKAGGFAFPQTCKPGKRGRLETTRRWLWKPLRSGGGHGIRPWRGGVLPADGVLQEQLTGMVGSAAFVANGRQAVLLGLTEQLVGRRAFGAAGFQYCGNLVPPSLPPGELGQLLRQAQALVTHLTEAFGLRGLNGLDFVWHEGRAWTLEVNPRPSASLELIDLVYELRVFDAHVRSFSGHLPAFELELAMAEGPAAGKAILFASQDVIVGDTGDWARQQIRDIPHPGAQIKHRQPICTLITTATTPAGCLRKLRARAAQLKARLEPVPS